MPSFGDLMQVGCRLPLDDIVFIDENKSEIDAVQYQVLVFDCIFQFLFSLDQFFLILFYLCDIPANNQEPVIVS